jgi:hypothetical protein
MKSVKLFFLAAALSAGISVTAQTADEIVDKNIAAMGGKEKLATLTSVRLTGSMSTQGMDIPLTITRAHQMGMRVEFEVMGTSNYQIANTKEGWTFMPIQGMTSPVQMEEEQYKSFAGQLDVQGIFYNYKEKGTTIEYIGTEKVDGTEAYNLKVTLKSGKVSNYYIDTKTNFLIKTSSKVNAGGEEVEVSNTYSNYKANADGYMFPYSSASMQGPITFEKIETNIKVDESLFKN